MHHVRLYPCPLHPTAPSAPQRPHPITPSHATLTTTPHHTTPHHTVSPTPPQVAKPAKDALSEVVRSADLISYTAEEGVRYLGEGQLLNSDSFPGNARNKLCLVSKVGATGGRVGTECK